MREKIEVGQIWKDKDRRREHSGKVRRFRVESLNHSQTLIACRELRIGGRVLLFRASRFGSGHANDSFVRCENEEVDL